MADSHSLLLLFLLLVIIFEEYPKKNRTRRNPSSRNKQEVKTALKFFKTLATFLFKMFATLLFLPYILTSMGTQLRQQRTCEKKTRKLYYELNAYVKSRKMVRSM